ncbi:MAG TPA: thiamine pyrophosphate-dependent dehydrogenase E1 component subunit alpha, partial [Spirochaetia bacterium]|nr:thiamine pyrophosphate-dependent dehydrogenase E1 component subunit alpha [Spirochaetia bacterium]
GIGMAITMQKGSEVVGCAFGDGATNAGGCHEGMSIAAIHKAPVVFVCENNGMAVSTPIQGVLPVRRISDRAVAYGMPGRTVDGTDAVEVLQAMDEFVSRARNGDGPSFLEATCYRWHGHTVWDTSGYRTKEENEAWMTHDPIPKLAEYLKSHGALADTEDGSWKQEIRQVIEEAVQFAKTSPAPEGTREDIQRFVYVESQEAVG